MAEETGASPRRSWRGAALGATTAVAIAVLVIILGGSQSRTTDATTAQGDDLRASPAVENPYLSLPPEKIIEQAKSLEKRMREGNDPDPKHLKKLLQSGQLRLIEKKEIEQTSAALRNITSSEYQAEANRLLRLLAQREEEGKLAENIGSRKSYTNDLETAFLKSGMDVSVTTTGVKGTTLVIRYVLIGRPFVFNTLNDQKLVARWRDLGFTNTRFTDGYTATWTCDLTALDCH